MYLVAAGWDLPPVRNGEQKTAQTSPLLTLENVFFKGRPDVTETNSNNFAGCAGESEPHARIKTGSGEIITGVSELPGGSDPSRAEDYMVGDV